MNQTTKVLGIGTMLAVQWMVASPAAQAVPKWPEVAQISSGMSIYQENDNPKQFYFVPKGIQVSRNDEDIKMINHGLFFNRLHPANSVTQYTLTFQPMVTGTDIDQALSELQKRYGNGASLSPLPITTASFEVTQKYNEKAQISTPFIVDVPSWTGDLHSFNQRFSVTMRGNAYEAEPAMSRFMTNRAGNAFVGTMHYGFRGINTPFTGHATVKVKQFFSKFRAHASAKFGFWGSADIATAIDTIKDDQSVFVDVVKDAGYESAVWKSITDKLVSILFQPVPTPPDAPAGSTSGLFQLSAAYSQVSEDKTITVTLTESTIKDHSGDVDVEGGGIAPSSLDPNIVYFCDMWAKYDRNRNACVNVCEPVIEYYNPASKTCAPAFGG